MRRRRLVTESLESRDLLTGFFQDSGQLLGDSNTQDVALGDVDGDGDLDAFVANLGNLNRVWLNDGSGFFVDSGQSFGHPNELGNSNSTGVQLGDLDNDGDLDAFVTNGGDPGVGDEPNRVWFNDGNGIFADSGQALGPDMQSLDVELGDVDGDGDLDAFVVNWIVGDKKNSPRHNVVWINDGDGFFTDSGQSLGDGRSVDVALGDLDLDGDLDAFVANAGDRGPGKASFGPDKVWFNDGAGNFTDSGQDIGLADDLDATSRAVSLGDFDADGDLDAFVANSGGSKPDLMWLNDGTGVFTDSGQRLGSAGGIGIDIGDIDGDGDIDAFVGNGSNETGVPPSVWLNDGSGVFMDSGQDLPLNSTMAPALGDLDGDGDLDAFLGNSPTLNNRNPPDTVLFNGNGGVVIAPISGLETSEDSMSASFTVMLSAQPTTSVMVDLSSNDMTEGTLVGAIDNTLTLVFDASNWNTPQTVTIVGVDDADEDGDVAYVITTAAIVSTDPNYNGVDPSDVLVTNVDNDGPMALTIHIADLDAVASSGVAGTWDAFVTILVLDPNGAPVVNADVNGFWSAGASGSSTCTTDIDGMCVVANYAVMRNVKSVTFSVSSISHSLFVYDAAGNDDPDGDSDGTSITILKP